ncbi:uncharacterized protein F4807DRAFT_438357 [Annulohypoxylon truncatum]|uniref:uncharacterized protein n=1 Tax=Annulohypoxylon truncatum TaxID=327061 RepID=UPI0020074720|nr:uncharacterized protein F4807DRAFT_438357 [Annulohypoxylon truncatum]KAI1206536.1 hypothetical protein F4807DRAFT_438357 [Annulohypoxylon truncatum]
MASLHIAVLFGNEELTRSLLEEGYDVNAYDKRLGTPLSIAIVKGYRSIVRLLSENGADHNDERFTSALIDSRIDEFNVPINIFNPHNKDKPLTSTLQDRSESPLHVSQPNAEEDRETDSISEASITWNTGQDLNIGARSKIKLLFRNGSEWEEAPADEATPLTGGLVPVESTYADYAVVQYMNRDDGKGGWFTSKVDINGSKLCGFLSRVLENYPEAGIGQTRTTLHPDIVGRLDPDLIGLFHRMERYVKLCENESDDETKEKAKLLLQMLKVIWHPLQYAVNESEATGLMKWDHLWAIYRPGDIAIYKDNDEWSAAKILEVEVIPESWNHPPYYKVTVKVVDWNGSYSGYKREAYMIRKYDGSKKVVDLEIHPLSYEPDPKKVKERLVKRGQKFQSLRGCFFRTREDFNVTRRVIIDNYAYHKFETGHVPTYTKLSGQSPTDEDSSDSEDHVEVGTRGLSDLPSHITRASPTQSERNEDLTPLTDDECFLCVPTMKGFDVQEKKWHDIQVDCLESITWNDEAFNHLAIQDNRKRLILAFAKQKQIENTEFDDFIARKGKSFIILLCGPPGIGKTLTAESVAERTRAPLYTLSAGDLGTEASSVEGSLKKALDMCSLWKAVMLIDEADVFLEARKTDNLERNGLVSVFLRLLEYYKGILFLTTNRVSTIDAAFESRIDLILPYDELDQAARRQVWTNLANLLIDGSHELSGADFDELSQQKLNGRQIKNTVKTALMLANSEGEKLKMEHLKIVLEVRQQAAEYLHSNQ